MLEYNATVLHMKASGLLRLPSRGAQTQLMPIILWNMRQLRNSINAIKRRIDCFRVSLFRLRDLLLSNF